MVAWSRIPVEIRHDIVKEMDFRTRFRFRHVSKTDQEIVDSVPLNLPRIVLKFASDDLAKMEFYLGINRKIVVDFAKNEEGMVKVKVSGESINKPITKLVKFENSALLTVTAFKNVAIHPKTLLNGLEVNINRLTDLTFLKLRLLLKGRYIRTKILFSRGPNSSFLQSFLPHCRDLLEIQTLCPGLKDTMPVHMVSWIRNLKVTVDDMPFGMPYSYDHLYTLIDNPITANCVEQLRRTHGRCEFKEHGPNDISMTGKQGSNYQYIRFNRCGALTYLTDLKVENQNPGNCEMRWACPQHADPFEYWYLHQTIKPYVTNFSEVFPSNPGMPPAKLFREMVHPNANEIDPVFVMQCSITMGANDWEEEMIKKYGEQKVENPVVSKVPKRSVMKSQASDGSDGKAAIVGGGEAKEGSKVAAEKVQEKPKESEGSVMVELKSEVAAGKVVKESEVSDKKGSVEELKPDVTAGGEAKKETDAQKSEGEVQKELKASEDLKGSAMDELKPKGSDVLKAPAGGEVQKELKFSDVLEYDDSDAENPFNTEEFKAKFNKSNSKTDKSWVILMIFAVLSVLFAFFFTFF